MGLAQLSNLLWRERDLREALLLELEEGPRRLDPGLPQKAVATHGTAAVLAAIRRTESMRDAELDGVARELGLPRDSGLCDLAGAAPEPWGSILGEHLESLSEVTSAIAAAGRPSRAASS